MSVTANSDTFPDETYQRQMKSYRRTRAAILESAKKSLETQGFASTSMIEIADRAEISRATLYNHFRDKGSVYRTLLEYEVERVFGMIDAHILPEEALSEMSQQISADPALETMRRTDPAVLLHMLTRIEDPLWQKVNQKLKRFVISESGSDIARLWLVGQVLQPLTDEQSREQARAISS